MKKNSDANFLTFRTSYSYITPFEIQCRIFIIILHGLKFDGFLQCRILLLLLNLFQTRKEVYKLQIIWLNGGGSVLKPVVCVVCFNRQPSTTAVAYVICHVTFETLKLEPYIVTTQTPQG